MSLILATCKLIGHLFQVFELISLFFFGISYDYRVIIYCCLCSALGFFPIFLLIESKQSSNKITRKEVDIRNYSQLTKANRNRQSSSLNGLNLIMALFCIIFENECISVCVQQCA